MIKVVWTSATLREEYFNQKLWEELAYEDAFRKLSEFEGYKQK